MSLMLLFKSGVSETKYFIRCMINRFCALGGHIEKKVVFESFGGRQYSDNPRAISEKMHELYPEYRLVWGSEKGQTLPGAPEYIEIFPIKSLRFRRERSTAIAYVRNEVMIGSIFKKKNQLFIQTWHGDRGFKKVLYDAWEAKGESGKERHFGDEKLTDIFIAGSDFGESVSRTAFHYNGKVLKVGSPRNDCLFHLNGSAQVRAKLGIEKDKKILLYAPTFRRKSKVVKSQVDLAETLKHLGSRGGSWVCLVRAHPKSQGVEMDTACEYIDVSKYPDMADLLMIADFLITDYSSSACDFVVRRKPVVLAQFDVEQYNEEERDFRININDTGFMIAKNQTELNTMIDSISDRQFAENCDEVMKFYGTNETGKSAETVCHIIDEHYQATVVIN